MTTNTPTPCYVKTVDESYYINVSDTARYSQDNML